MARHMPRRAIASPVDPLLADLPKAKRRWARTDPVLAALAREAPPPARAFGAALPFRALVESITHQQVSLQAGRTIFARVDAACGGPATPEGILKAGPDALRAAGLSRPKVAYVLDLAQKSVTGEVDLARIAELPDDDIIEQLTRVRGIGVWTAKMFLLFHLGRPDVFVPEDLGIQLAVEKAYDVPRSRVQAKLRTRQALWSPYNSLAALTLWNWRRVVA